MMRKKILYIGQSFPYPPDSGGRIKALDTLRALSKTYDVTAIFVSEEKPSPNALSYVSKLGIHAKVFYLPSILFPVYRDIKKMILNYVHTIPFSAYKYYDRKIADQVLNITQKLDPDIIHVCHVSMSQYISSKDKRQIRFLELENVETQFQFSRFLYTRHFLKRMHIFFEGVVSFLFESRKFKLFNHIFTICEEDRIFLKRFFQFKQASTLTVFMPPSQEKRVFQYAPRILFVGTTGWPPNEDALTWFLDRIFPLIFKKNPNIEFHVVGRIYEPHKERWSQTRNVFFHEKQDDLSTYIRTSNVFVLPFRIGGGIKVKALTAFTSGIPVVSTQMGIRGYKVTHNKECLIADSPTSFAYSVIKLLENPKFASTLAKKARLYATKYHGDNVRNIFFEKYRSLNGYYEQHTRKS